jgi:hypothetical protein
VREMIVLVVFMKLIVFFFYPAGVSDLDEKAVTATSFLVSIRYSEFLRTVHLTSDLQGKETFFVEIIGFKRRIKLTRSRFKHFVSEATLIFT